MNKSASLLLLAFNLIVAPAVRADESTVETDLIQVKCNLCHTAIRIYAMEPSRLKEIVDRMTAKNPEWFKNVDSRHLVEVLSTMLKDPKMDARRKAWEEAVGRGKALYADHSLGTTGKACLDCHAEGSLGRVQDMYPKFNEKLNRFESMEERLSNMIVTKLGGTAPAVGDPRITDLTLYLKSLR
jgi:cytochrome c